MVSVSRVRVKVLMRGKGEERKEREGAGGNERQCLHMWVFGVAGSCMYSPSMYVLGLGSLRQVFY